MCANKSNRGSRRLPLYAAETLLGWRVIRWISRIKGSDMVAQGFARDVHDEQFNHIGFQLMPTRQMEQQQLSMHTSTGLVPRDVMLNAGTQFKHGKSRTAGMTEDQRLHRTHPTTGKLLPPEDAVELAQARVREWARK
jgi:hypothetical protein